MVQGRIGPEFHELPPDAPPPNGALYNGYIHAHQSHQNLILVAWVGIHRLRRLGLGFGVSIVSLQRAFIPEERTWFPAHCWQWRPFSAPLSSSLSFSSLLQPLRPLLPPFQPSAGQNNDRVRFCNRDRWLSFLCMSRHPSWSSRKQKLRNVSPLLHVLTFWRACGVVFLFLLPQPL